MTSDELSLLAGKRAALEHPELYRRLLDTLAEGVCLTDADGVIVYTNPAEDEMFGYTPGELFGRHVSLLNGFDAEEYSLRLEALTAEIRRTGFWKGEWLNRRKNGERFYTKSHISSVDVEGRSHALSIQEDITEERLQAEALRDRETRLEIAAQAADLGVWDWDLRTQAFVYSKRARDICGFTPDQPVTFAEVAAVTHPEDYPLTSAQAQRALDPDVRDTKPYTYRILRRDGSIRWVVAHGRAVFEEEEGTLKAVRYVGTLQDITERYDIDMQLRESEARFRAMADSTPAPAWVTNADGKVVFANKAFADVAGVSAAELAGDAWIGLLHPDDLARVAALRAAAWAGGFKPYGWEGRFKNPKGGWFWMRVAAGPRFDAQGAFQGYVGIATDVTDAHRAEAELRSSEERLRLAMISSNTADWNWDAVTDRLQLSTAAAEMVGLPPCLSWGELRATMNEQNGRALADTVRAALENRGAWEVELHIKRPSDQRRLWIAARGKAVLSESGAVLGMTGLISDISERRQREETERLLIREVDHRAKNVLAVVQALARLTPFKGREQYLSDFVGRVDALGRVHGLLSSNRWSHVDLARLIDNELAAVRDGRVRVGGEAVSIGPVAAQPLSMILHELTTNAVKYGALSCDEGRLEVDWRILPSGRIELNWREHVPTPLEAPANIGFGSVLIDNTLRQLQGAITREWRATGLVCALEFDGGEPGRPAPVIRSEEPVPERGPRRLIKVLLVEDEPLIALDLKTTLEAIGASVVGPAYSLEEASALALDGGFDCAILDVNLGGRHVGPILEILTGRATPFALVTGYEDPGIDAPVVRKPVTPERVQAVLAGLIAQLESRQTP
jgi:PAS domain S-box-containing protein